MKAEYYEKIKKAKDGQGRSPSQSKKLANSQSESSINAVRALIPTEGDSVDE